MKILALDTATENCSAALLINGALLSREQLLGRGHAEAILPMVNELLAAGGVALRQLTAIAFGRGPGGFTGVRLAASITQGLAFAADLPVLAVSDLRALAQRVLDEDAAATRVLACTDARMQEVYCGAFERGPGRAALEACPECVLAPERLQLPQGWLTDGTVIGAGSGFAAYPRLGGILGARGLIRPGLWPRAQEIAQLAVAEVEAGRLLAAEDAVPVYLRDDVTQPARKVTPSS
jgi:tRNA threonylcarbamoyladenosine biosynthesis protein TsaB